MVRHANDMLPALPSNIILGCKCLVGTNTLAYYSEASLTKRLIRLRPGSRVSPDPSIRLKRLQ
jgi:hypothetical protein